MINPLKNICKKAIAQSKNIDLSDCVYGQHTHSFINEPLNYYYFIAGLVRSEKLSHILEIGTNWGGATMSICKGIHPAQIKNNKIVTIDIHYKNKEGFKNFPQIKIKQGDSLNESVIKKVFEIFDRPIDLLFIDSIHTYEDTKLNFEIYSELKPKYVLLDDIHLNNSMNWLWRELKEKFNDKTFDVSKIINRPWGFGIIKNY